MTYFDPVIIYRNPVQYVECLLITKLMSTGIKHDGSYRYLTLLKEVKSDVEI